MKKHYYLGFNARRKGAISRLFMHGSKKDYANLEKFLSEKYGGEAVLAKNGRSALALALMAYFNKGDKIIVNGFTCYAVFEAVKAAGLVPIFADISRNDLNFNTDTLGKLWEEESSKNTEPISGIIVQNSLGNPVDMEAIERFAGKHGLTIIEDLAHSVSINYPDGREVGTVGAAAILSFGKEKAIDTVSGGAVVLRYPCNLVTKAPSQAPERTEIQGKRQITAPFRSPLKKDSLRERFYPVFMALSRGLTYVKLNGVLMRVLLRFHWVEKSADNRLDLERMPTKFEAKLALLQLEELKQGKSPLRDFYLVQNRDEVLKKLQKAGYYFDGFWYERPVSPERYYKKVHFDEERCSVATEISKQIINFPTFYKKAELLKAKKIISEYLIREEKDG